MCKELNTKIKINEHTATKQQRSRRDEPLYFLSNKNQCVGRAVRRWRITHYAPDVITGCGSRPHI